MLNIWKMLSSHMFHVNSVGRYPQMLCRPRPDSACKSPRRRTDRDKVLLLTEGFKNFDQPQKQRGGFWLFLHGVADTVEENDALLAVCLKRLERCSFQD